MKMNKRGIYSFFLVIMMFFVFLWAFYKIAGAEVLQVRVGDDQVAQIEAYQLGERLLFFIDKAADYSYASSLYYFELNGHYTKCGDFAGYRLWRNRTGVCMPTEQRINTVFPAIFSDEMNTYLDDYSAIELDPVTSADVYVSLDDRSIKGFPFHAQEVNLENPFYLVPLSFSVDVGSGFHYEGVEAFLADVTDACGEEQNVFDDYALDACVEEHVEQVRADYLNDYGIEIRANEDCDSFIRKVIDYVLPDDYLCATSDDACDCAETGETTVGRVCRTDNREERFCVSHENVNLPIDGEIRNPITRFAYRIEDRAPPLPVKIVEKDGELGFVTSKSGDVVEYHAYRAPKGEPIDFSKSAVIMKDLGHGWVTVPLGISAELFGAAVIAVDLSGLRYSPPRVS